MELQNVLPADIEKRSMEIIAEELGEIQLDPEKVSIVKRVIHTSADFDYARTLHFSNGVVEKALEALKKGATIVTDTNMACVGINKPGLNKLGGKAVCFMADADVASFLISYLLPYQSNWIRFLLSGSGLLDVSLIII